MATLKLGSTSLAGFAFGGETEVITPTKAKNALRAPKITQAAALELRGQSSPPLIGGGGGDLPGTNWLLTNGVWNDNGVWDDTQNWTE